MKLLDKTLASKKKKRDPFYGKARRLAKKMNVRITVERVNGFIRVGKACSTG